MLRRISKLSYFCTSAAATNTNTNLAFKAIRDPATSQKIVSQFAVNPQHRQKLDALAQVILSLPNLQIQYLIGLQNQQRLAKGEKITDGMVINTGDDRLNAIEYLYQRKWLHDVWKEYHIMTSLFSSQGDKQGVQEVAAVTKQIYEFQLTSIDTAQKIKIIKVIRELLGLGLKQAKDIVDKVPTIMKKGKKQEGEKLKQQLAKSGCVMTLK